MLSAPARAQGDPRVHDGRVDDNGQRPRWFDRATSPDFWIIAGPILLFLGVFILVLID